jgi:hypothetical protein
MAIVLEANYAKKLGLPNFSSHQYSVTIRTELTDLAQVEAESARLYALLQDAVDREIQEVGFMPDASTYGMNGPANGAHDQTNGNGRASQPAATRPFARPTSTAWLRKACASRIFSRRRKSAHPAGPRCSPGVTQFAVACAMTSIASSGGSRRAGCPTARSPSPKRSSRAVMPPRPSANGISASGPTIRRIILASTGSITILVCRIPTI